MSAKLLRRLNVLMGTKVYSEVTKVSVIADKSISLRRLIV